MSIDDLYVSPANHVELIYCSFCGASTFEAALMVKAPAAAICNDCIEVCVDAVSEHVEVLREESAAWADHVFNLGRCA